MPPRGPVFPIDHAGLAEALSVLAYESRLQMLETLRLPRPVSEILIAPMRAQGGDNPDRPMSKQAVQAHLDKLVDTGLVRVESQEVDGRALNHYAANAPRLYALAEELRSLCVRYAARVPAGNTTGTLAAGHTSPRTPGPCLVLAHGVYEGKAFALTESTGRDHRWVIGRRKEAFVSLDYDPFVSGEHAVVTREGAGFRITDARGSKNGTALNWQLLPKGGSERLRAGDIVGVGRSLLVYVPKNADEAAQAAETA